MATTKKKAPAKKAPAVKKAAPPKRTRAAAIATKKPPTSTELAAILGVKLTKALRADQVRRLRKALPGYINVIDNAADQLEADQAVLRPKGVTPDSMRKLQEQQKDLAAREAVAFTVYRSIYEQRLGVDDQLMKILETLARRVNNLADDDPDLLDHWKTVLDYLASFHKPHAAADDPSGGGGGGGGGTDPNAKG